MGTVEALIHRPRTVWVRRVVFQVHLWLGVGLSAYALLIGATGAVLVFRPEIQAAAYPTFFEVAHRPDAEPASPERLRQVVASAYPGHEVAGIDWPTYRRGTVLAYISRPSEFRTVFLHPDNAEIIGELEVSRTRSPLRSRAHTLRPHRPREVPGAGGDDGPAGAAIGRSGRDSGRHGP